MSWHRPRLDLHSPWHLTLVFLAFGLAGWLLQASPVLKFDVEGTGGIAQVFHSRHGHWNEAESIPTVVLPGSRTVAMRLPWTLPARIRLDPIAHAGSVKLGSVRYEFLVFRHTLAPADILPLRDSTVQTLSTDAGGTVQLHAYDRDPQLSIPAPPSLLVWRASGLALAVLPLALLMSALPWRRLRDPPAAAFAVALGFLGVSFAAFVYMVGWSDASHPILDDWRYFFPGRFSLIDGDAEWLVAAGNDTYFLTGQALDWALIRLSGGSTVVVRVFALAMLAVFLGLASALARKHAGLFASLALVGLSLTLSARSYWTQQFIAYHQFIPVLALFFVIWVSGDDERSRHPDGLPAGSGIGFGQRVAMIVATLAAGLSYISGALVFVALTAAYLALTPHALVPSQHRRRPILWYVGIPAILASTLQIWMVSTRQGSLLESSHAGAMSWPWEGNFWWFMSGLFGRSFGVPSGLLAMDIALMMATMILAVLVLVVAIRHRKQRSAGGHVFVAVGLFACAFAYSAIVSAGRAALGTADMPPQTIADIAKWRFHYWWLAAILPLAIAITLNTWLARRRLAVLACLALSLTLFALKVHTWRTTDLPFFVETRHAVHEGTACVRAAIITHGTERARILCPSFYPTDLAPALWAADRAKLSFARDLLQERQR